MKILNEVMLAVNAIALAANVIVILFAWHYAEEHKVIVQEQRKQEYKQAWSGNAKRGNDE